MRLTLQQSGEDFKSAKHYDSGENAAARLTFEPCRP